jgi:vacuole morphology and inheritance protein 14
LAYDYFSKYLSDPTEDVRVATENLLADILREIRDVTTVSRQLQQRLKSKSSVESLRHVECEPENLPDLNLESAERALLFLENDDEQEILAHESQIKNTGPSEFGDRDVGGE